MPLKKDGQPRFANHGSVADTTQGGHIYDASIFRVLKPWKPGSQPESLVTSPDVSSSNKKKHSPPSRVYSQRRIIDLLSRREGSLLTISCIRQIKVPLVVQAMRDILEGSMILSISAGESF